MRPHTIIRNFLRLSSLCFAVVFVVVFARLIYGDYMVFGVGEHVVLTREVRITEQMYAAASMYAADHDRLPRSIADLTPYVGADSAKAIGRFSTARNRNNDITVADAMAVPAQLAHGIVPNTTRDTITCLHADSSGTHLAACAHPRAAERLWQQHGVLSGWAVSLAVVVAAVVAGIYSGQTYLPYLAWTACGAPTLEQGDDIHG